MKRTRSAAVGTVTAVLAGLAGGGVAGYALAAGSAKVITACQTATSVRSITAGSRPAKCPAGQRRTVWNGAGPQGPEGNPGPLGAPAVHTGPNQTVIGNWDPTVKKITPHPTLITFDGSHFWVVNFAGPVTEVAESGAVLKTLPDSGNPDDIVYDGSHVWVSNTSANSLTEINPATAKIIRTLSGASYDLGAPEGMAVTPGGHLFVVDAATSTDPQGAVTELDTSNGSFVRVIDNASDGFKDPGDIVYDGAHLWITNYHGASVTELNASDGSLVRVVSGRSYGFTMPLDITFDGSHLWVINYGAFTVTEINASDGSLVQVLSDPSYGFDFPTAILAVGNEVFVANAGSDDVIELDAATGDLHAVLNQSYYGFNAPDWLAYDGSSLWVANGKGGTLTIVPLSP